MAARAPGSVHAVSRNTLERYNYDDVHSALQLTKPFYDRFIPAIDASDFTLREGNLEKALDFVAVCHTND